MKDLIFGAADKYTWEQIRPWAKSIRACGFTGDAVLLTYRTGTPENAASIAKGCHDLDITVVSADHDNWAKPIEHNTRNRDTQSHQLRFFHLWQFLSGNSIVDSDLRAVDYYRFVITTDTRDVIFQKDPVKFLEPNLTKGISEILAPSEGIRYRDESWGADNVAQGFGPYVARASQDFEIYNVGTIAGRAQAIRDLSLTLYSMGEERFIPNDQSAFNLLVNGDLLTVRRVRHNEGWACQCGTTKDPTKIDTFRPHLTTTEPFIDHTSGIAYTTNGEKEFYLLHQYDRVPGLAEKINERYSD